MELCCLYICFSPIFGSSKLISKLQWAWVSLTWHGFRVRNVKFYRLGSIIVVTNTYINHLYKIKPLSFFDKKNKSRMLMLKCDNKYTIYLV